MGSFDFAVKLRGGGFDVGVPDALIFYMPMKFSLEFVPVISPHLIDSERETLNDIIYKALDHEYCGIMVKCSIKRMDYLGTSSEK